MSVPATPKALSTLHADATDRPCAAIFHYRCTLSYGHGGAHESGDSAEIIAELARYRTVLEEIIDSWDSPAPAARQDVRYQAAVRAARAALNATAPRR